MQYMFRITYKVAIKIPHFISLEQINWEILVTFFLNRYNYHNFHMFFIYANLRLWILSFYWLYFMLYFKWYFSLICTLNSVVMSDIYFCLPTLIFIPSVPCIRQYVFSYVFNLPFIKIYFFLCLKVLLFFKDLLLYNNIVIFEISIISEY